MAKFGSSFNLLLVLISIQTAVATQTAPKFRPLQPCVRLVAQLSSAEKEQTEHRQTIVEELESLKTLRAADPFWDDDYDLYINTVTKLWPIFNRGILRTVIGEELESMGLSKDEQRQGLVKFKTFTPLKQLAFVESLFKRLSKIIPPELGFENLRIQLKLSSAYNLTDGDLEQFVGFWAEGRAENFDAVKAVIWLELRRPEVNLLAGWPAEEPRVQPQSWWQRWFSRRPPVTHLATVALEEPKPLPKLRVPSTAEELVFEDKVSAVDPTEFESFLRDSKLPLEIRIPAIAKSIPMLSFQQLLLLRADEAIFNLLPDQLRRDIRFILGAAADLRALRAKRKVLQKILETPLKAQMNAAELMHIRQQLHLDFSGTHWEPSELVTAMETFFRENVLSDRLSKTQFLEFLEEFYRILLERTANAGRAHQALIQHEGAHEKMRTLVYEYISKYALTYDEITRLTMEFRTVMIQGSYSSSGGRPFTYSQLLDFILRMPDDLARDTPEQIKEKLDAMDEEIKAKLAELYGKNSWPKLLSQ